MFQKATSLTVATQIAEDQVPGFSFVQGNRYPPFLPPQITSLSDYEFQNHPSPTPLKLFVHFTEINPNFTETCKKKKTQDMHQYRSVGDLLERSSAEDLAVLVDNRLAVSQQHALECIKNSWASSMSGSYPSYLFRPGDAICGTVIRSGIPRDPAQGNKHD